MFHIVLYEPEIPPNTGNIMRLCANTGSQLHLIHPLGFDLNEKQLRRAGLDYRDLAIVHEHESIDAFLKETTIHTYYACSTKAKRNYTEAQFKPDDALIFGPESRGLPQNYLDQLNDAQKIRIPMLKQSRSLNLSNAVAVIVYEAWRQNGFVYA